MLVLYRTPVCPFCDEIEERLQDWVLAHRVVTVQEGHPLPDTPEGTAPPALREGDQIYGDEQAITAFLDDLERDVAFSRQVQSDACYLDPDQPDVCL